MTRVFSFSPMQTVWAALERLRNRLFASSSCAPLVVEDLPAQHSRTERPLLTPQDIERTISSINTWASCQSDLERARAQAPASRYGQRQRLEARELEDDLHQRIAAVLAGACARTGHQLESEEILEMWSLLDTYRRWLVRSFFPNHGCRSDVVLKRARWALLEYLNTWEYTTK